jgi:RNA polymerase sigma-70 factor (ECF subfamily)
MLPPPSAPVPDTSWTLLRSVQDDSPDGWARLVSLYAPVLVRWCRCARLQDADIENVMQEVFLTLHRYIGSFRQDRGSGRFRAFLSTITRTRIADHHRGEARQPKQLDVEALSLLEDRTLDETAVDAQFRHLELRRILDVVCAEVKESTWEAFRLTAIEGRTSDEAAAATGLTVKAARLAKRRVLQRLRDLRE